MTPSQTRTPLVVAALLAAILLSTHAASAATIGLKDTFNGGTTEGWFAGGLGVGLTPPVPPAQIPSGGPAGAGDGFLQITGVGGCLPGGAPSPGCKLVALNGAQWAGNYLAANIGSIEMDLRNLGSTPLTIRLLFEDPHMAPPLDEAVTTFGAVLPVGGAWTHVKFDITLAGLTPLFSGVDLVRLMSDVTLLRIIHSPTAADPVSVVGQLGVDNIQADAIPEPASLLLMGSGLAAVARRLRFRLQR